MSVTESATVVLQCDRRNCPNSVMITKLFRDECNLAAFQLGWRLCLTKILCPQCVERRAKRRKK